MLTGLAFYIIASPPPPHLAYPSIQRKNGLFKKAYELGVLCSVEVAVIIFGRLLIFILTTLILFLSYQRSVQATMLSSTSMDPAISTILSKGISGLADYIFCSYCLLLKYPSARWREGHSWSPGLLGKC